MTTRVSTGYQKAALDAGDGPIFDTTGIISIYTGTQPDHADDAPNSKGAVTLLGTLTLAADAFGAATGTTYNNCKITAGAITSDSAADNSGTATWFRMQLAADQGAGSSATAKRLDGACGVGSGELQFDNATIVAGGVIACSAFTINAQE